MCILFKCLVVRNTSQANFGRNMKSFARVLSMFLSMLMVLYVIPAEVYSIETSATELTTDKKEATDNVLSMENTEVTAL